VGYRRQLDQELAAAGFGDRGFPDGRVLRLCGGAADVTISHIGRELGITRQRTEDQPRLPDYLGSCASVTGVWE
jgi:hypothetical protein